ncbi:MAG: polyhydroxyalkanoate synthesis regulator phasin [Glaciecola sp.]|jgi:polyhydroxyalkanoate synthesis regulator phasin
MRILIYISNMHLIETKLLILNIYKVNNMKNIDKIKETASTAEDMARKVWLAGLGAYGKGYEELTGRIEALSTDSNKFFDELVAKGEKLEAEGKVKVEEVKNDVVAKTEIESRIEAVRSKLGFSNTDNDQKIEDLSAKIDALTTAVAQLAVESAGKKA